MPSPRLVVSNPSDDRVGLPADVGDADLVRAALAGHPDAPPVVLQRFSPIARRILRRMLGPQTDAQDFVQDVFLAFFKELRNLRDPNVVRSFIIGITLRVAGSELRRRKVQRWLRLTDTGVLPEVAAVPDADARQALLRFYRHLDTLSTADRSLFVLRHIEGLELTEVAQVLGISLATVKRRLRRVSDRVTRLVGRDMLLAEYVEGLGGGGRA